MEFIFINSLEMLHGKEKEWDDFISSCNSGHPYNTSSFIKGNEGIYKDVNTLGWYIGYKDGKIRFGGYCFTRPDKKGLAIEFPHGPVAENKEYLLQGLLEIKNSNILQGNIFLGPYFLNEGSILKEIEAIGYIKTNRLWHEATVQIDLEKPLEEIANNFTKSARNAVKSAQSQGYFVKSAETEDEIINFVTMHNKLAEERTFGKVSSEYIHRIVNSSNGKEQWANVYLLYNKEGELLAGSQLVFSKKNAWGQRGASVKGKPANTQYLQYEIIKDLKNKHISKYDLGGINQKELQKCTVTRFKTSLNGRVFQNILPQFCLYKEE